MTEVQPREIKILETAEDIQSRRKEVLSRYTVFKELCQDRRLQLEDSRRYQYFKRDADELESWILEKLQTASDESYKDPTNLQVNDDSMDNVYNILNINTVLINKVSLFANWNKEQNFETLDKSTCTVKCLSIQM